MLFWGPGLLCAQDDHAGLWLGETTLTHVSHFNDPDRFAPKFRASADTEMRVILHVASDKRVSLLTHVTVIPGEEAAGEKIVAGLRRDIAQSREFPGRRIRRFGTASYDLPRRELPPTPLPKDFDPTSLTDEYLRSFPLEGELKPGGTVRTPQSGLVLDQWHRSNPFRHPFHPMHTTGFRIKRTMSLKFDEVSAKEGMSRAAIGVDTLTGTWNEEIRGLLKEDEPIALRGRFALFRLSRTTILD